MLTAEDLGYSGQALDMRVPDYQAPKVCRLKRADSMNWSADNGSHRKLSAWLVCRGFGERERLGKDSKVQGIVVGLNKFLSERSMKCVFLWKHHCQISQSNVDQMHVMS